MISSLMKKELMLLCCPSVVSAVPGALNILKGRSTHIQLFLPLLAFHLINHTLISPQYRNDELLVSALGCLNNKCYVNVSAGAAPEVRELFGRHDPDFVQMCRGEVRYKYSLYKLL